jgi:NAD(P) transhydrogenase subunit alpha
VEEKTMRIGVPAETTAGETRVAVTPETAKKIIAQGHQVHVQSGAGVAASVTDAAYEAAGAHITDVAGALGAELVLKVRAPFGAELGHMKSGAALVGMLNPFDTEGLQAHRRCGPHQLCTRSCSAYHPSAKHGCVVFASQYRGLQSRDDGGR